MIPEVDLIVASCESLIELIMRQQVAVVELQHRIRELEARSTGGIQPRGMPANEMNPGGKPKGDGGRGSAGSRSSAALGWSSPIASNALDECSHCGTGLYGGWEHRTREVIEIPVVQVQVTEHAVIARICGK